MLLIFDMSIFKFSETYSENNSTIIPQLFPLQNLVTEFLKFKQAYYYLKYIYVTYKINN